MKNKTQKEIDKMARQFILHAVQAYLNDPHSDQIFLRDWYVSDKDKMRLLVMRLTREVYEAVHV